MNPYHANNTYVLDQNIPADQGFDLFIKALSEQENVAPDLLGNITILSRTEGYYPFAVKWGHFDGTFAGTPCVRYKDALIRKDRVSGPYQVSCRRVYALSDTLAKTCERIVPKDEEGERPDHLNLLVDIEHYLSENFHLFQNATHIGTAETVDDVNGKLLKRKDKRYRDSVDTICQRTAHDRVDGDEVENLEYDWRATSEGDELLYVPLLVVEYAYGGKTYVAAVPLQEDRFEPLITYPYYYKVQALENAGNQETGAIRHGGMYGFGFWAGAA
ncbi:MAG: hypothetical protein IIX28_03365, partial [Clostridia bacterium]|nr:hypothetical protein [Clostridia bacterium]